MSQTDYVTIKLLFFAKAREFTGEREVFIQVPKIIGGKDLLNFIVKKYNLHSLKSNVILAVNENWIDLNCDLRLEEADEVAVIPPVSGEKELLKMNWVKLTTDKLSVDSIYSKVCSPEYGAVSLFVGTTRNSFNDQTVSKLEYEAYEGMAVKSLEKICQKIRKKFEVGNIAIFHRLGDVPIQEASVIIAISSTHRKPALEAVPFAIDSLKADVPIWKKEIYQDGETSKWKENFECGWSGTEDVISSDNVEMVQLYEEVVEADSDYEVPAHLIQINASLQEVNRRINSFINRKREQINISNVQDFCLERSNDFADSTCARVAAVLMRRKDSKSHLKVHRVENSVGPQTHGFNTASHLPVSENSNATPNCPPGAEERLSNVERYLNINQTSKDVFSRLKAIEDKILYLESISPEYFDFDKGENPKRKLGNFFGKKIYSSSDLDIKMRKLEAKLQDKSCI